MAPYLSLFKKEKKRSLNFLKREYIDAAAGTRTREARMRQRVSFGALYGQTRRPGQLGDRG